MASPRVRILDGFDDPGFGPTLWAELLAVGDSDVVFLTHEWQRAWWQSFGRGRLLLLVAERDGRGVALAPLFEDSGMIFFVGSGGSDYLDFIGDVGDPEVLAALLDAARREAPGFEGFRLYHVAEDSRTGEHLQRAAERIGLEVVDEGSLGAPAIDLRAHPDAAVAAANKKSLVRHERYFRREGSLQVQHLTSGEAILPCLGAFFEQHVERWQETPYPSLFTDPAQRSFYELLTRTAGGSGWLRFTELIWQERSIAFHFGFQYKGSYLWYKPSFDIRLARHSPGEVLLRQMLLAAEEEEVRTFDFGLGEEAFKSRFASHCNWVRTWGLYPRSQVASPREGVEP
jgi:CelD/BcsL family acetyltransferase involved in cellulose biosynthesis